MPTTPRMAYICGPRCMRSKIIAHQNPYLITSSSYLASTKGPPRIRTDTWEQHRTLLRVVIWRARTSLIHHQTHYDSASQSNLLPEGAGRIWGGVHWLLLKGPWLHWDRVDADIPAQGSSQIPSANQCCSQLRLRTHMEYPHTSPKNTDGAGVITFPEALPEVYQILSEDKKWFICGNIHPGSGNCCPILQSG